VSATNKDDDIGHLVYIAQDEVSRRNAGTAQPTSAKRPSLGTGWVLVVWLAAAALWGWQLWPKGPSEAEVKAELDTLMGEARESVERYLATQRSLPERLPVPVPALVVRYEIIDRTAQPPTYALTGVIGEVSQRWTNATAPGGKP
jgi:hypothetical protein